MATSIQSNFSYGVISKSLQGRVDTDLYQSALNRGHNVVIDLLGGVRTRPPLRGVKYKDLKVQNAPIVLFQFSATDSEIWQVSPTGVTKLVAFLADSVVAGGRYDFVTGVPEFARRVTYTQTGNQVTIVGSDFTPFIVSRSEVEGALEKVAISSSLATKVQTFGNPAAITNYQQRLILAGSEITPSTLEASRVGALDDFRVSTPINEADAISARLVSKSLDRIVQFGELRYLIIFTEGSEWVLLGQLTPSNIAVDSFSRWGCSEVPVVEAQDFILFVPPDRKTVRALELNQYDNLKSRDLALLSQDIFRGRVVEAVAHANRHAIVVFDDGTAAICTYDGESGAPAWTTMDTNLGALKDVFSVSVNRRNKFFFVVQHPESSERHLFEFDPEDDTGPYADQLDVITSADVAQGYKDLSVFPSVVSTFGVYDDEHEVATLSNTFSPTGYPRLTLPASVDFSKPSTFTVGVPYKSYMETLNVSYTTQGANYGKRLSVARLLIQVNDTRGLLAGPDEDRMYLQQLRQFEPLGTAVKPFTGFHWLPIPREWKTNGRVRIQCESPYRMEILSVIPYSDQGDD